MENLHLFRNAMLCGILFMAFMLTACGSSKPSNLLVGTWVSEYNEIVELRDDGSCVAPFTYNASWWESAERYTVKSDNTLVLSSTEGHADDSFKYVESKEEALDDGSYYFVSKDILVIDRVEYTRSE